MNDYYREFKDYKVIAQVYDINSKKVFEESAVVNLPSDGVVNDALTIRFPENISQVHFIKLILKDEKGKMFLLISIGVLMTNMKEARL